MFSNPAGQFLRQKLAKRRLLGCLLAVVLTTLFTWPHRAWAQPDQRLQTLEENNYTVTAFVPVLVTGPNAPAPNESLQGEVDDIFYDTDVTLGQAGSGYISATLAEKTTYKISDYNLNGPSTYSGGALLEIDQAVARKFSEKGYGAVLVVPSPTDIDPKTMADLRPHKKGDLHLLITIPTAARVRTIASGQHLGSNPQKINNPAYDRILEDSPVQPATQPSDDQHGSPFLDKGDLDNYVDRLNRQPGRHVDVALSAAEDPNEYDLDYLVNEVKSWYVYTQVSNTGTEDTQPWRYRFGFVDNELTGNDDILNLDAVTDFSGTSSIVGSYEFPIAPWVRYLSTDKLRGRVYASWDEYTARDLGFPGNNFSGDDQTLGAEAIYNIYNYRTFFLDAIAGGRAEHLQVKSAIEDTDANVDYFIPYTGIRAQDNERTFSYFGALNVEGGFGGDSAQVITNLGRVRPNRDFLLAEPSGQLSVFLEPLFAPDTFKSGQGTLANEFVILGHAQYAFDARLAPQFEQTVGGFSTVRGYPEAETSGDTVYVGTAEYRLHIPRLLGVEPNPSTTIFGEPFRWAPQQPYQNPDWDLIARAFFDAGRVIQDRILPGEYNDTLLSAGAGLELQLRQNIDIRGDWGMALTNVKNGTQAGSSRFTLLVTLLY